MTRIPPGADRLLVVISDVEMGAGGDLDDLPRSGFLRDLLLSYNDAPYDGLAVDFVFNGDTFDFLKTPYDAAYPRHITAEIALAKLDSIATAHGDFFATIRELLAFTGPPRGVSFIVGNHDAELLFPAVQTELERRCGALRRIGFPGFELDVGQVHVEHGSQADQMFRMDPNMPFLDSDDGQILNLPWGALALLEVAIPLHPLLHHLERVRPRTKLFEIMPEAKELLLARYWRYWTRDYLKRLISRSDPLRHLTWNMIKEIVYRFASVDTDASFNGHFRRALTRGSSQRLFVVGHRHAAGWWSYGDRKLLQTGCMRDEYMLSEDGAVERLIPKTHAEAYLRGDVLLRSHLVETDGAPSPDHAPESVLSLLPVVRELLGTDKERGEAVAEREAHEDESEA